MMDSELKHLLSTYSDQEGISEQVCLRDLLSGVRCLASELQLDFEQALTESDVSTQDRLLQAFDPCL
jgi:hypothetical protein